MQMKLTTNKQALARIINRHMEREEARLAVRRTMWLLAHYYLQGARSFKVFDTRNGIVKGTIIDEDGKLEFQSQKLLSDLNDIVGRMSTIDVRPVVERFGNSLGSIRDRSVTQILLDASFDEESLKKVHRYFCWNMATLGSCGLEVRAEEHVSLGLQGELEIVHPKELFPFPSIGQDQTKAMGIIRQRYVPLSMLKEKYGRKINKTSMEKMDWYQVDPGETWSDILYDEEDVGSGLVYNESSSQGKGVPDGPHEKDFIGVVKVRELRLLGHNGLVERYIVSSGDFILQDEDLSEDEVYNPLGRGVFYDNGDWHGAGAFEVMYSMHREMERLLRHLFINIRDIDKYGTVVLPQGQMNTDNMLRDTGHGLKVMFWEPDLTAEGFKPFNIMPFNSGDVPGKVAGFAREILANLNPVKDLIEEKGRVDSAAGLAFLEEQMQKAMTSPTFGVTQAYSTVYKSAAQILGVMAKQGQRTLPVSRLTPDLAGARIDPESDSVSFAANPMPDVGRLRYSLRSFSAKSSAARKAEALELFKEQVNPDPMNFTILALEEGLDVAMWLDEDRGAYESVVRNILMLYGDGEEGGDITVAPYMAKPELQIRVLRAFMASPIMSVAGVDIQNNFKAYHDFLLQSMGMVLPAAIPNPDDAAMLAAQEEANGNPNVAGRIQPALAQ